MFVEIGISCWLICGIVITIRDGDEDDDDVDEDDDEDGPPKTGRKPPAFSAPKASTFGSGAVGEKPPECKQN